jgi:hypothetical protein
MKVSIQKDKKTGQWSYLERASWTVRVNDVEVGHIYAHDRSLNSTYYWAISSVENLGIPHINKANLHLALSECKAQVKKYIKEHCTAKKVMCRN